MSLLDRITGQIIRLGAGALAAGRIKMTAAGLEHIPGEGPVLLIARHYHHLFDGVVLLLSVPRPIRILVTLDWAKNKPVRRLMTLATTMARWPVVPRGDTLRACGDPGRGQSGALTRVDIKRYQRAALRDSVALLAQGCLLVVFPEGYPNIDPHYTPKTKPEDILPFRTGFATIGAVTEKRLGIKVPIVPAGFHYTKDSCWSARLNIGEAVYLADFVSRRALVSCVEKRVADLSTFSWGSPS
ncbi:MAG TPA: 1-acyl-sn-glycerol-3-phosphate acyltransferase [Candidatus Binatia bacterium]|nr:1-acyl-sn-glycerol-3-phosphate acyltransferase [Candidatus Binatia bacterium]